MVLPRLYAIVDRKTLDRWGVGVRGFAEELRDGGVRLVQYRDKGSGPQEVLRAAGEIAQVFEGTEATLILNDRADLAALLGWGCHVGQGDLSPVDVRRVVGDGMVVGVSTHTEGEVVEAERILGGVEMGVCGLHPIEPRTLAEDHGRATRAMPPSQNRDMGHPDLCSYVAVGPVFGTRTKLDAETVVGLEGVRAARALTDRPLVAIGGIGLGNARSVVEAGADSVAVISGLIVEGRTVVDVVREFLAELA